MSEAGDLLCLALINRSLVLQIKIYDLVKENYKQF